jgi:RNA polymerase sigma-70 factor, ECF subfamily
VADENLHLRFETVVLPHLDAAYNLARWITRNDEDARDVVQEAVLRALRYFHALRGDDARPWLLQIVRRTSYSWIERNHPLDVVALEDADSEWQQIPAPSAEEPPAIVTRNAERIQINRALADLPVVFREAIVLRELEDLSYKDIARIVDVPVGTVMSRLARGRGLLRKALDSHFPASKPTAIAAGTQENSDAP